MILIILYYDDSYFKELFYVRDSPTQSVLLGAYKDSTLVSACCFLLAGDAAVYHLGCNSRIVPGASDFVIRSSIRRLLSSYGVRHINFTGGRTSDEKDPLFKFKKRFSNDIKPFYIATRVLDQQIYDFAIASFLDLHPHVKVSKFMPWS